MWKNDDLVDNFDIIVEDGLHTFDANVCFFENSVHKLNKIKMDITLSKIIMIMIPDYLN